MADKNENKERPTPDFVSVSLPEGTGSFTFISGRVTYRFTGPGPHKVLQQDYDRIPALKKLPRWEGPKPSARSAAANTHKEK